MIRWLYFMPMGTRATMGLMWYWLSVPSPRIWTTPQYDGTNSHVASTYVTQSPTCDCCNTPPLLRCPHPKQLRHPRSTSSGPLGTAPRQRGPHAAARQVRRQKGNCPSPPPPRNSTPSRKPTPGPYRHLDSTLGRLKHQITTCGGDVPWQKHDIQRERLARLQHNHLEHGRLEGLVITGDAVDAQRLATCTRRVRYGRIPVTCPTHVAGKSSPARCRARGAPENGRPVTQSTVAHVSSRPTSSARLRPLARHSQPAACSRTNTHKTHIST